MRHIALIDLIQRSPVLSHKFYLLCIFFSNWHIGGLSSKAVVVSTLINYLNLTKYFVVPFYWLIQPLCIFLFFSEEEENEEFEDMLNSMRDVLVSTGEIHLCITVTPVNLTLYQLHDGLRIEKCTLNVSSSSFVIRVNLLYPQPSLILLSIIINLFGVILS